MISMKLLFISGILPFFLRQKIPMLKIGTEANILSFFTNTEDDGVNIKWAHAVNTMAKLERALDSRTFIYSYRIGVWLAALLYLRIFMHCTSYVIAF